MLIKFLSGTRMSQITSNIDDIEKYIYKKSPLVFIIQTHIEATNCEHCARYLDYFKPTIRVHLHSYSFNRDNNYRIKPFYPSCIEGISLFKSYFSEIVQPTKGVTVVPSRHSNELISPIPVLTEE